MREDGYYWVRVDDDPEWEPAWWFLNEWRVFGDYLNGDCFSRKDVTEIGPRLEAPAITKKC